MDIVLTGSVAYDYLMRFPGYFKDHILTDQLESISLSFLVESMVKQRGGIAPNIAYTLALLGEQPRVMATVGEDFEEYRVFLENVGVNTGLIKVVQKEFTASFFANTDRANSQISSFYPGAMSYAGQLSFYDLKDDLPELVMISPNDPKAMERYIRECSELNIPYLYDPSQQIVRMTAEELSEGILSCYALFVNEYEFGLVKKLTGMDQAKILEKAEFLVITCGAEGSVVYTRTGRHAVPTVPAEMISDPTGVGDAFRAGFLKGFGMNLDWVTCGQMGSLAATYCLEQDGPQGHHYTPAEFVARFRRHFDDQGQLDPLILS